MKKAIIAVAMLCSVIALPASLAFAQTAQTSTNLKVDAMAGMHMMNMGSTTASAQMHMAPGATMMSPAALANLISTAQSRADQEISRRVDALNKLSTNVNAMTKISASDQSALSANIQSQITAMNTLQAKIAADVADGSTTSLKADIQSITGSYRIFALIIPQGAIEAGADHMLDIAGMFTTLAGQLQTRITAAQTAGNNMSTSVAALADLNAKVADANTQSNAAVTEIASLQPDNGVQSVMQSNTAALKDAHSKVQVAEQDLVTARQDAGTIVKALESLKVSASATSTASTTVQSGVPI